MTPKDFEEGKTIAYYGENRGLIKEYGVPQKIIFVDNRFKIDSSTDVITHFIDSEGNNKSQTFAAGSYYASCCRIVDMPAMSPEQRTEALYKYIRIEIESICIENRWRVEPDWHIKLIDLETFIKKQQELH